MHFFVGWPVQTQATRDPPKQEVQRKASEGANEDSPTEIDEQGLCN